MVRPGFGDVDADAADVRQLAGQQRVVEDARQQLPPEHAAHPADVMHYEAVGHDLAEADQALYAHRRGTARSRSAGDHIPRPAP